MPKVLHAPAASATAQSTRLAKTPCLESGCTHTQRRSSNLKGEMPCASVWGTCWVGRMFSSFCQDAKKLCWAASTSFPNSSVHADNPPRPAEQINWTKACTKLLGDLPLASSELLLGQHYRGSFDCHAFGGALLFHEQIQGAIARLAISETCLSLLCAAFRMGRRPRTANLTTSKPHARAGEVQGQVLIKTGDNCSEVIRAGAIILHIRRQTCRRRRPLNHYACQVIECIKANASHGIRLNVDLEPSSLTNIEKERFFVDGSWTHWLVSLFETESRQEIKHHANQHSTGH